MDISDINYGKIIKLAREAKGCGQTELASMLDMGKSTLANYESGYSKPPSETFGKIADLLGFSIIEMLALGGVSEKVSSMFLPKNPQFINDKTIPLVTPKALDTFVSSGKIGFYESYVSVPSSMFNSSDDYICIKITDNSMKDDNLKKNDYAFVKITSTIPDKSIVLAVGKKDHDIIIRRFFRDDHIISFIPASDTGRHSVIRTDERDNEYKIIGYVEKCLTNPEQI